MLGIIGGTGLTRLANLEITRREVVRTPFGEPSGALTFGQICDQEVVFLARHGYGHTIPPHEVNYRANIWALREVGVDRIASVATVGGIHSELAAGTLVVPDQIIDYTWGRAHTFFVSGERTVVHLDFTQPYCQAMRAMILSAAHEAGVGARDGGTYACVQGPRLETAAEIDRYERDGAHMVGMTAMPEAYLAQEIGICYASIGVVANDAAGRGAAKQGIRPQQIEAALEQIMPKVRLLLERLVAQEAPSCDLY